MKHYIVGPVELYDSTKNVLNKGYTYFRTENYGNMVKECLNKLSDYLGNPVENSIIYLAASGTGAMDAVVDNCMTNQDKALVINGGNFGHRFCELLQWHNINFDSIDLKWNEVLTPKDLEPYENKGYTTFFINHDETSSGKLYDMELVSKFCKRNNMILVVDAISSFLADEYDMQKYGIDVTIISSQKGLCLSPGMSLVAFSKRMKDKVLSNPAPSSYYFNFKNYFSNIERGQTPYTPTVTIMYELKDMIDKIENAGGVEVWRNYVKQKCDYFRQKAKSLELIIPDYPKSNTLTPLYFEEVDASEIVKLLREKFEIFVNPCGGDLARHLLRVAHIGNTTIEDIDDLLEKLMLSIKEIKNRELINDRK